jgi:very-short-patch-repair endonuclease
LKYGTGQVLFDEKRREDRIRALGYIVVRWTWDEIFRDPQRVVARIQAAAALYQRQWRRQA